MKRLLLSIGVPIEVAVTGATTNSTTQYVTGLIDEILIAAPATNGVAIAAVTGNVHVSVSPSTGVGFSATTLYTNGDATAAGSWRPRFVPTDASGNALTSLTVLEPFYAVGDAVTFRVIQAGTTNEVDWKCFLKLR